MKLFIILLAIFLLVVERLFASEVEINNAWMTWKTKHSKIYATHLENSKRFGIWIHNLARIVTHNQLYELGLTTFKMTMNKFGDLTSEEFARLYLAPKIKVILSHEFIDFMPQNDVLDEDLPKLVNWTAKGYVTKVKDQGQCGSCWAFSSTGAVEGQYFKDNKELLSFSEQQLVDCSGNFSNNGCGGGLMDNSFRYLQTHYLMKESDYPYTAQDDECVYSQSKGIVSCKRHVDVKKGSEKDLAKKSSQVGPISVAIDASNQSFQFYHSGIYVEPNCDSQSLDHGVLLVGYGEIDKNSQYWIVKNSWGADWGKNGYIWMAKNRNNQCGIASMASYPTQCHQK